MWKNKLVRVAAVVSLRSPCQQIWFNNEVVKIMATILTFPRPRSDRRPMKIKEILLCLWATFIYRKDPGEYIWAAGFILIWLD